MMRISGFRELHQQGDSRARQITSVRAPQSDKDRKQESAALGAVHTKAARVSFSRH
jgi:hypothetical protein